MRRVIVTGSCEFTDRAAVRRDLLILIEHWSCQPGHITVVNGMARGLDMIARTVALELGMCAEDHPADWGVYGRSAGPRRNAEMVDDGADGCLAYPIGESRGTRGCMKLAAAAGILVWDRSGTFELPAQPSIQSVQGF